MADLKPKIVVVDDSSDLGKMVEIFLSRQGYEVTSFTSGKKALEYLRDNPVNLMLTDINMPEMSGLDLIKAIKKTKPDLPIIAMTGSPDPEIIDELSKLGVSNCLEKPLFLSYLEDVMREMGTGEIEEK